MSELTVQFPLPLEPLVNQRDGPAVLRWAYNRQFLDSDGVQVMPGTQSSGFGVSVACSIASGLVTVDEDALLWTTDNAQDPSPGSIWVSAWLLTTRGVLIAQLQIAGKTQFVVTESLTPTCTWAQFSNYNQAVALWQSNPQYYYTAAEVNRLIDGSFALHPATETTLGTVFTSVEPAIEGNPVAWITDDPLVRDAIKIQGVDVSDTAPVDTQVLAFNQANNQYEPSNQAAGTGNVISNEVSSVDGEIVLFSGTGGKTIKRGNQTGLLRGTSGVVSASTVGTTDIDNDAVTYAKIQNVSAASRILGRGSASGAGDVQELTVGSGISISGTVISATGTGGDVVGPASATDNAITRFDSTTGKLIQNSAVTVDDSGLVAGATVNDPTTAQQIGSKNYIDSAVAVVAGNIPKISGLASGGIVFWESAYTFRVSAATFYIQGILYSALEQTVTLDAADPALDRIDVLALDTTGTLVKITGTAAAQPSEPDYDPSTQLKLTFVFVGASTTQPAGVSNENIYIDNAEWTTSTSGSGWNANSTNNPYSGTKCIEGTNVANNAYVQLQRSSSTALDSFATLTMFIRSKATWGNNRVLRAQFFLNGVAKGTAVTIASGYWGFNSSTTGVYQFLAIPMAQFVLSAGQLINQLRITDSGGSIGMYIDNLVLQANGTSIGPPAPVTGITQAQADARYLQISLNLSDVLVDATARTNIGAAASGAVTASGLTQATGKMLGRSTASTGAIEEITVGGGLSLSAGTLTGTGGGSSVPTTSQGDILYASAANTLSALAKDTNATRYLSNTGSSNNPAWAQVALSTGISGFGTGVATALGTNVGSAGAFVTFNGALGTPSSGTLTSCTGLPVSSGISGFGTGVASALAVNVGSAGAFVTFNGALGTPSSGTLTSCTGLPISTGVSGLGTGVATFLATPSSANLRSALTDENGTGAALFDSCTSATFITPVLGTPTSGNLSNCTADGTNGVGYLNIPQNSQSAAYTTVLGDAGKQIFHPSSDNNARTFTIDSNANVAYPIGTAITFINLINTVTIAITSDTLILAGTGTTGSRTLAANGVATAVKVASTTWIISGTGLT